MNFPVFDFPIFMFCQSGQPGLEPLYPLVKSVWKLSTSQSFDTGLDATFLVLTGQQRVFADCL